MLGTHGYKRLRMTELLILGFRGFGNAIFGTNP